jgi:GDP-L-fucose synthase
MKIRLNNSIRCLITGAHGFLGKHLVNNLKERKIEIFSSSSKKNDLRDLNSYEKIFKFSKPNIVFNLAARVGGILENKLYPADFFYDNMAIIINTFYLSNKYKVKKLINIGAGCGYPLNAIEPLREHDMFKGLPQAESKAYSMSKKMIFIANDAYFKQYKLMTNTVIPSNLYGEYDNFNLEKSHVIAALIRKFFEAKHNNKKSVEIWGDGTAKRDFIHADDVSKSLIYLAENYKSIEPVNICLGEQNSIKTVAKYLRKISQFQGEIIWKKDMPVGQKSREFSKTKMKKVLKKNNMKFMNLYDGLSRTYKWFEDNYKSKMIRL